MLRRLVLLSFAFGLLLAKVARCEDRVELPAPPTTWAERRRSCG